METSLLILKPDAVQRGLMGRIVSRLEDKGLQIVGVKLMQISPELAAPAPLRATVPSPEGNPPNAASTWRSVSS